MSEIANPHDLLFRRMLSSRETAQDFLRSYLPESVLACLNLESLEMTGVSVVDSELRRHVSDLVRALLWALRHAFDEDLVDLIPWILAELRSVAGTRTGRQAVEALLRYFSAVGDRVDERALREAVMQLFPAEGDRIMATLAEKWIKDGVEQGVQEGRQQGLRQSTVATAQEFLLEVLSTRFRGIPNSLQQLIRTTEDVTLLRKLVKVATTAESIETFREELDTARGGA